MLVNQECLRWFISGTCSGACSTVSHLLIYMNELLVDRTMWFEELWEKYEETE